MLKATSPVGRRFVRSARGAFAALLVASATVAASGVEALAAPQSAIVVDAKTGKILYAKDPDGPRHPASLTKMMTLYLLFGALDSGKLSLDSRLQVSQFASRQSPTKLGLKPGSTIAVRDAMLGLITRSANDAAVVIAENLGGSEAAFAARMTATARSIGMSRTTFRNASGLPNPNQWTTARDMVTLGRALQERYPVYYRYFATKSFTYNGQVIGNHNRLLGRIEGVDGIKTGYTNASGFNLVTSIKRDNRFVVASVMGGTSGASRDRQMVTLLDNYMPTAYAGPSRANTFFAKAKPVPAPEPVVAAAVDDEVVETAAAVAPAPAPRPVVAQAKPVVQPKIVTASAAGPAPALAAPRQPEPAPAPVAVAAAPEPDVDEGPRMVFLQGPSGKPIAAPVVMTASVSGPVPTADNDPSEEGEEGTTIAQGDADDNAIAQPSGSGIQGWKVQIAASPSQDGARDLLDNAKSKGGKALASATPVVEAVKKGGSTFYRARFAGFSNKDKARAACDYLKKRSVSCLAIPN